MRHPGEQIAQPFRDGALTRPKLHNALALRAQHHEAADRIPRRAARLAHCQRRERQPGQDEKREDTGQRAERHTCCHGQQQEPCHENHDAAKHAIRRHRILAFSACEALAEATGHLPGNPEEREPQDAKRQRQQQRNPSHDPVEHGPFGHANRNRLRCKPKAHQEAVVHAQIPRHRPPGVVFAQPQLREGIRCRVQAHELVARIGTRAELGAPYLFRATNQLFICPVVQVERHRAHGRVHTTRQHAHRFLVVGAEQGDVVPVERLAHNQARGTAERSPIPKHQAHGHDGERSPKLLRRAERYPRRTSFQRLQPRATVADALRKNADGVPRRDGSMHITERVKVLRHQSRVVYLPVHGHRPNGLHQPPDARVGEERRLGHEPHIAAGSDHNEGWVDERVGVICHEQHRPCRRHARTRNCDAVVHVTGQTADQGHER